MELPSILICLELAIFVNLVSCQFRFTGDVDSFKGCWQGNIIPYKIGDGFSQDQRNHIKWQISILHNATCLRWMDEADAHWEVRESVLFVHGEQCLLEIHRATATRTVFKVNLNDYCFKGNWIMHKILNALGFHLEHQRADRNCYVRISNRALDDEPFKIRPWSEGKWLERFPYDMYSVMHFHRASRIKSRTERWYDLWQPMGNYEGELTTLDIWKLLYKFCQYPHYCDIDPHYCENMERFEQDCIEIHS